MIYCTIYFNIRLTDVVNPDYLPLLIMPSNFFYFSVLKNDIGEV